MSLNKREIHEHNQNGPTGCAFYIKLFKKHSPKWVIYLLKVSPGCTCCMFQRKTILEARIPQCHCTKGQVLSADSTYNINQHKTLDPSQPHLATKEHQEHSRPLNLTPPCLKEHFCVGPFEVIYIVFSMFDWELPCRVQHA